MASLVQRNGGFSLVYYDGGKQVWMTLGAITKDQADQVLEEVEALLAGRKREDRIREVLAAVGKCEIPERRIPLEQVWQVYLQEPHARQRESTQRMRANHFREFLAWMQKELPAVKYLHEVSPRMARDFLRSCAESGAAGQTMNNRISTLRSVFAASVVPAGLTCNVWSLQKRYELAAISKRALTVDEVRRLLEVARDFGPRSMAEPVFWPAAVAIGFHTGLRFGDVAELERSEYDLAEGVIRLVENKKWKRNTALVFPIHQDFAGYLPADGDGFVWPLAAEKYRQSNSKFYKEFGQLCELAGIRTERPAAEGERRISGVVKEVGFHSLRHTYVSVARDLGAPLDDVRQVVGHTNASMTEHYNQSLAAARRTAALMPTLGTTGRPDAEG